MRQKFEPEFMNLRMCERSVVLMKKDFFVCQFRTFRSQFVVQTACIIFLYHCFTLLQIIDKGDSLSIPKKKKNRGHHLPGRWNGDLRLFRRTSTRRYPLLRILFRFGCEHCQTFLWNHLAHFFCTSNFSCRILCNAPTEIPTISSISRTVIRQSSITTW